MIPRRAVSLALVPLAAATAEAQQPPGPLTYSIVGSSSCSTRPCYDQVMSSVPVQRFLLDLAHGPRDVRTADSALSGAGVAVADLLKLRLIRLEGDRYVLNFPLFTAADVARIREVADRYAGSLAAAVMARQSDIASALLAYDAPGVDRKAVAYFVLCCVSLDWGGLKLTASKGYRTATQQRPDGQYVPAAEEMSRASLQGIYWGSHNSGYGGVQFTSFGDHFSPRYTLPDLFWRLPGRAASGYPDSVQGGPRSLVGASLDASAARIGRMMLALRDGGKSVAELARAAGVEEGEAGALLDAVAGLDYVTRVGDRYRANVPVLTGRDEAMGHRLLALGNQVMDQWLAANYGAIKGELADLSFTRSGVPFEDGFTMIWHYIFGIANRKLVEAGLFADPYAAERKFKGSIPVVFDLELQ